MEPMNPLQIAIKAAGSQQALADALGIRSASISGWKKTGRIPAERVLAVEAVTRISRAVLRPDLYGAPQLPASALVTPGCKHRSVHPKPNRTQPSTRGTTK